MGEGEGEGVLGSPGAAPSAGEEGGVGVAVRQVTDLRTWPTRPHAAEMELRLGNISDVMLQW